MYIYLCLKSQLKELHLILACDKEREKVFPHLSNIGFKNKNSKSHWVRAVLPDINEVGRWKPCSGRRYPIHLWSHMKNDGTFQSKDPTNLSNKENFKL